jgi:hypothetical protein
VVLATLDIVLAVVELTELVELVLVVAVKAATSALSRSDVVEEIAEIDIMSFHRCRIHIQATYWQGAKIISRAEPSAATRG